MIQLVERQCKPWFDISVNRCAFPAIRGGDTRVLNKHVPHYGTAPLQVTVLYLPVAVIAVIFWSSM